ncbi:MAG: sulfatase [Leadbetterella sp.]
MKIKCFLVVTIFLSIIFKANSQAKYNVVFIAVDDLKPLLGCYGESYMQTPNIDKLAKMGTVFRSNYCQQAVCAPSRASIMTGMRPDYTRIWDLQTQMRDMNPNIITLPQHFKKNGYFTTAIGKIYDYRAVDKEDDVVSWSESYARVTEADYPIEFGRPKRNYYQSKASLELLDKIKNEADTRGLKDKELTAFMNANRGPAFEAADVPDDAYLDGVVAKKAAAKIAELAQENQPFFYGIGFSRPHLPFTAPQKYWDLYDRKTLKTASFQAHSKDSPSMAFQPSSELVNNYVLPNGDHYAKDFLPFTTDQQLDLIHGYYAAISYMDAQVGKILEAIKTHNLEKNTIIVLWGDHGWHLGDHLMWCKHSNFEQATRAPLIIAAPEMKGGQSTESLSEFVDVFPTLTDLANIETPRGLAGKSLVPILKNTNKKVKDYAQSQYPRNGDKTMGYALRTDRYRIVAWYDSDFKKDKITESEKPIAVELFDYVQDPLEKENLANNPAYKKVLKTHLKLVNHFLATQSQSR